MGNNDVEKSAYRVNSPNLEVIKTQINELDIPLMGLTIFIADISEDGACSYDVILSNYDEESGFG